MKPSACVCDARSILRLPAHLKHWAIRLCQRRIDHHSCAPPSASVRAWSGSCVFFSAHSQEREHSAVTRALKRHLGSQLKAETLSTFHLSSAVLIKKKKERWLSSAWLLSLRLEQNDQLQILLRGEKRATLWFILLDLETGDLLIALIKNSKIRSKKRNLRIKCSWPINVVVNLVKNNLKETKDVLKGHLGGQSNPKRHPIAVDLPHLRVPKGRGLDFCKHTVCQRLRSLWSSELYRLSSSKIT